MWPSHSNCRTHNCRTQMESDTRKLLVLYNTAWHVGENAETVPARQCLYFFVETIRNDVEGLSRLCEVALLCL